MAGWLASVNRLRNDCILPGLPSWFHCLIVLTLNQPQDFSNQRCRPKIFLETGHHLTDQLGDCTEFKLQGASNLDLNTLTFSDYRKTTTAKAYVGIAPHDGGLVFSDLYPGSISESEITELASAIDFVQEGHEFMTDKGFAVKELCATEGIFHNRPPMKFSEQFSQVETADNFDIASLDPC